MRVGLTEERKGIAEMEKKHQNNLGMRKELQMAKKPLKIDTNTKCQKTFLVRWTYMWTETCTQH